MSPSFFLLSLKDLRLWLHLGVSEEEKATPQLVSFTIDIAFHQPLPAMVSDVLEDTVCYGALTQKIKTLCAGQRFNLIEHLGHQIYTTVVAATQPHHHLIDTITVITHKVGLPLTEVHGGALFTLQGKP